MQFSCMQILILIRLQNILP